MKTTIHLTTLLPLLLIATLSQAQTPDDPLSELRQLIGQQNYAGAWQLATTLSPEYEGDAEFDFYYGLSAAQTGNHQPALFSFERLSASYPQVQRYRLELARSYFFLGNLDQAEAEFRTVLDSNPPAAVRNNILQFLQRIDEQRKKMQRRFTASLGIASGYDSNFNSATSAEQIDLLDGALTARIRRDQRAMDSAFVQLRGQAAWISPLSRHSAWDASAQLSRKDNLSNNDYDLTGLSTQAGLRWLNGPVQWRAGAGAGHYWLGSSSLQSDLTLSLDGYWRWQPQWQPFARLQLALQNNHLNDDLDILQPQVQAGIDWRQGPFSTQLSLLLSSDISRHDADYQARDTVGLNLNGQYSRNVSDWYAAASWRDYRFQDQYPLDNLLLGGQTRDEQLVQLVVGYRHRLQHKLSLYGQLSHLRHSSNIDVYEYDRTLAEAGLTLTF